MVYSGGRGTICGVLLYVREYLDKKQFVWDSLNNVCDAVWNFSQNASSSEFTLQKTWKSNVGREVGWFDGSNRWNAQEGESLNFNFLDGVVAYFKHHGGSNEGFQVSSFPRTENRACHTLVLPKRWQPPVID
eukprot:761606-Hanusia_phi.AAC.1